jgi:hypothetical protein
MEFVFRARVRAMSAVAIVTLLGCGVAGLTGCRADADPPKGAKKSGSAGGTSGARADTAPAIRPWIPRPIVARAGRKPVGTSSSGSSPGAGSPRVGSFASDSPGTGAGNDDSVRSAGAVVDSAKSSRPITTAHAKRRYQLTPADSARWPVKGPAPLPGSLLPEKRIVAYYGNPKSTRMGILGQIPPADMLPRLERTATEWAEADPGRAVMPALHLIVTVAQEKPGPGARYRLRHSDQLIEQVLGWAEERGWIVFLDVQVGHSTVADELPHLVKYLERPYVHLALDPEFAMKHGGIPGRRIGTLDAADVNLASRLLADIVDRKQLPPKVLVVHRFTQRMLTNHDRIALDPRVQIVINMDGFGAPWHKEDAYKFYVVPEPVQYTGLKLFYKNDRNPGTRKPDFAPSCAADVYETVGCGDDGLMTPKQVLELWPQPLYIQYQ